MNLVVGFDDIIASQQAQSMNETGDSVTMPDQFDNLSEVADAFATNSRLWGGDYEEKLDTLDMKWGGTE